MLDGPGPSVDRGTDVTVARISEIAVDGHLRGPAGEGGNPAIRHPAIVKALVTEGHARIAVGSKAKCWIESVAMKIHVPAKAAGPLVHAVKSRRQLLPQRLIEIGGQAGIVERTSVEIEIPNAGKSGFFSDAI